MDRTQYNSKDQVSHAVFSQIKFLSGSQAQTREGTSSWFSSVLSGGDTTEKTHLWPSIYPTLNRRHLLWHRDAADNSVSTFSFLISLGTLSAPCSTMCKGCAGCSVCSMVHALLCMHNVQVQPYAYPVNGKQILEKAFICLELEGCCKPEGAIHG